MGCLCKAAPELRSFLPTAEVEDLMLQEQTLRLEGVQAKHMSGCRGAEATEAVEDGAYEQGFQDRGSSLPAAQGPQIGDVLRCPAVSLVLLSQGHASPVMCMHV